MTVIEIRLLGPVGLWSSLRQIPLGTPKQRCLLAALAVAPGRPVPIDTLIERLWGQSPPEKTKNSLYTYVARLRGLLNESAGGVKLTRNAGSYSLHIAPECIDLHQARTLIDQATSPVHDAYAVRLYRQALWLWRDEPLAGLRGSWVERTRASLGQERLAALTGCFAAELRLGRHTQVASELSTATAEHPMDEILAGQLMISLHRSRRRVGALAEFHRVKAELAGQLGLDPGPALLHLYKAVLCNNPSLDLPNTSPSSLSLVTAYWT